MSSAYVYIVECSDGTYYTGYTTDVERRVKEHNTGNGAKYTKGRGPVELLHVEEFDSTSKAMKREHEIKGMTREEKTEIIESGN